MASCHNASLPSFSGSISGFPLWVGALAALTSAAAFGALIDALIYRPLRQRGASVLGIFLSSLGVAAAGAGLLQLIFGAQVRQVPGFPNATFFFNDVTITKLQLTSTVAILITLSVMTCLLGYTRIGHVITAVRSNAEVAMAVGIPVHRISYLVFATASACAGLVAYFETISFVTSPTMGIQPVLFGVIGVFLGGTSSWKGAVLGGFVLGLLIVFSGLFLSQNVGVLLVFAVLAIIVVLKPEGLIGTGGRV